MTVDCGYLQRTERIYGADRESECGYIWAGEYRV